VLKIVSFLEKRLKLRRLNELQGKKKKVVKGWSLAVSFEYSPR
jgi:hypothetical protein